MLKSESIKTISLSLVKAQKNMTAATKDAKNPFFKSTYADLSAVIDACVPALNDQSIYVTQVVTTRARQDGSEVPTLETIFLHESGEYIGSQTDIVMKQNGNAQDYGSAVSYARRYGLQALAGLKSADDDGNAASGKVTTSTKSEPVKQSVTFVQVKEAVAPSGNTSASVIPTVSAGIEPVAPKSFRTRPKSTQEDAF